MPRDPQEELRSFLDTALSYAYFNPNADGVTPIPVRRVDGSRLVVIVGENASGKSFLRKLFSGLSRRDSIEFMGLSMQGRRQGAANPMIGFIYGDEEYNSTGQNSAGTVLIGIRTCRERSTPHRIFWDEPDIGLSDGWAAGMGIAIRDFALTMPELTQAAFVVTHSKALVRELLPTAPTYICVGTDPPASLAEWVERPASPRPLAELSEEAHQRFRLIQAILNGNDRSRSGS